MSKLIKFALMTSTALNAVSASAQVPSYAVTAVLPDNSVVKDITSSGQAAVGNITSVLNGLPFHWSPRPGTIMLNPVAPNQSNAVGITDDGVIYGNFSNTTFGGAWTAGLRWNSPLAAPTLLPIAGQSNYAEILHVTNNNLVNVLKNIGPQAAPSEIQDAFTQTPQALPQGIYVIDYLSSNGDFAVGRGPAGTPSYRFVPGQTIARTYTDPFGEGFGVVTVNNKGKAAGFVRNSAQSEYDLPARWNEDQNLQIMGVLPSHQTDYVKGLTENNIAFGFGTRIGASTEAVIWGEDNQPVLVKDRVRWSTRVQANNWILTSVTAANADGSVLAATVTDTQGTAAWEDDKRFSVILGPKKKAPGQRLML